MREVERAIESLNVDGAVRWNGKSFPSLQLAISAVTDESSHVTLILNEQPEPARTQATSPQRAETEEYRITVRQYMIKPATAEFSFHDKWNNGVPMPLRTMVGHVIQETAGMVKMELHGEARPSGTCMRCGRTITHPVSLLYGIGPECGGHHHISPDGMTLAQCREAVSKITWTGWIIKSAIIAQERV